MKRTITLAVAVLCAVAVGVVSNVQDVDAADHLDPGGASTLGTASDIGDLYAWHSDGTMKTILTFAGPVEATEGTYDADVLYGIHIDGADEDFEPDTTIWARFGQAEGGEWGVWLQNVPGADAGTIVGAVETDLSSGGAMARAGQFDDPFFMDLQGFQDTLGSGNLADYLAENPNGDDFFAGLNISALVVEFPLDAIDFEGPYRVWATTGEN